MLSMMLKMLLGMLLGMLSGWGRGEGVRVGAGVSPQVSWVLMCPPELLSWSLQGLLVQKETFLIY